MDNKNQKFSDYIRGIKWSSLSYAGDIAIIFICVISFAIPVSSLIRLISKVFAAITGVI